MKIVFILGYSGVGKSTLGRYFEKERGWVHIEGDPASQNKTNSDSIAPPPGGLFTNQYFNEVRNYLDKTRRCSALITMPSNTIIDQAASNRLHSIGVQAAYLMALPYFCLEQFLKREKATGRGLTAYHWIANNLQLSHFLTSPIGAGTLKFIDVTCGGERTSPDKIHDSLISQI